MEMLLVCLLVMGAGVSAEERVKRQATYTFPGPRSDRSYSRQAAAGYPQQPPPQQQQNAPAVYVEESDEGEQYHQQQHQPRRQFQGQPVQPQYAPAAPQRGPPAAPAYEPPRAPAPAPRQQSYGAAPQAPPKRRPAASTSSRANKYGSAPQQSLNGGQDDDEEEEQGPDPLTLLLEDSQFTCGGKNDGYYADDSVNCQVFHYCVAGAKHSWMCPEGTVFHQVHLNCVPDSQDICSQSQKFHFVNEYLYKPVDYDGPNNTARYSQRYYPDGYVVGDPIVAPQDQPAPRRPAQAPQVQSYPAPAPAPRPQSRQLAPPAPPAYRQQQQPSQADRYSQGSSRPASRPASRPVESYPEEAPQVYRGPPPTQAAPQAQPQPQQIYRVIPPQAAPPAPQGYRGTPPQAVPQTYRVSPQGPPAPPPGYSEENQYQPPPQQRRPSVPSQRSSSGYAPPRQLYRSTSGRSASGYPVYGAGANNQAAGVQYDEDY